MHDIRASEKRCYRIITEIYTLYMAGWKDKLDGFLQINGREMFDNDGTVRREEAID